MASSSTAAAGLDGPTARRGLSSKVLQMKFMQRSEEKTAAPPQQPQTRAAHQWTALPAVSQSSAPALTATATASTSSQPPPIRILGGDDDDLTPPAFVAGRRSFGRNKALELTLDEFRSRGHGQGGGGREAAGGTGQTDGGDGAEEEAEESEEEDEDKNAAHGRRGGRGEKGEWQRHGRMSEGSAGGDRRGGRRDRDRGEGESRKRRATMSAAEMGREEQRRKKQQRMQSGFKRPADTG